MMALCGGVVAVGSSFQNVLWCFSVAVQPNHTLMFLSAQESHFPQNDVSSPNEVLKFSSWSTCSRKTGHASAVRTVHPVTQTRRLHGHDYLCPKWLSLWETFPLLLCIRASLSALHHLCCTTNESLLKLNKDCTDLCNQGPNLQSE